MAFICVLGMHRSGTSCLTGITQKFDVELGEVFTENLYNKKGNRENGRIVYLNDHVLNTNGGAWNSPVPVNNWTPEEAGERDSIIAELQGRSAANWGFKDPRSLFTMPFWLEAINEPRFIGTFRHPHRVALSLHSRDKTPLEEGWELWHAYNLRLLELARQYDFAMTDFDLPPEEYLDDAIGKLIALGLDAGYSDAARQFFDSGLRNQADSPVHADLPAHISQLYDELLTYKQDHDTRHG